MVSSLSIKELTSFHKEKDSLITIVLKDQSNLQKEEISPQPDLVVIDEECNKVFYIQQQLNKHDNQSQLFIKTAVLKNHPRLKLATNLLDYNMHVMSKHVIKFLLETDHKFYDIQTDLIPFLAENQYNNKLN